MRRSLFALIACLAGCGFSLGDPDLGGEDGVVAPPRRHRETNGAEMESPADDAPLPSSNLSADAGAAGSGTGGNAGKDGAAPPAGGALKAFVSSALKTGNLGGVQGADDLCNQLAKAAGLPGTYRAWIGTAAIKPLDRMTANGPWQRVDGKTVATTKGVLASGTLEAPLNKDEKGQTPPLAEDRVWTGSTGQDCGGWTGAGAGHVGEAEHNGGKWTSLVDEACSEVNRVYCFQQ